MTPAKELTLEEIHAQLKALTAAVGKLMDAQKPAPAKDKVPNLRDVQPDAKNHSHTFTIPKGSAKDAFNNATPVEAVALPNYYLSGKTKAEDLVDIPTTLAALAMETVRSNNRKALYPVYLEDYLPEQRMDPAERAALKIIEGTSPLGFGIIAIRAQGQNGSAETLFVVEDQLRQQVAVVGSEPIPPELDKKLAESGVIYAVKGEAGTVEKINNFLADGARERGIRGLLTTGNIQNVVETLIKACSAICEFTDELTQVANKSAYSGTTVGAVLDHGLIEKPTVFTSIMKASAKPRGIK